MIGEMFAIGQLNSFSYSTTNDDDDCEEDGKYLMIDICHFWIVQLSRMFSLSNENLLRTQKRFRVDCPKRVIKKCAFDIDSLLKPTMNSSYVDDTDDGSSDDGQVHSETFCSSPVSSYQLVNQLKTNEYRTISSSFESMAHTNTKLKRIRTTFTSEQLERLEAEFEKQQYMVGNERLYLAKTLNLSEAQVKIWFQNRRIKWRRQIQDSHSTLE